MKTRILSFCLAGALLLSTGATASAVRVGSSAPQSAVSRDWAVTPVSTTLSFDRIGDKVRANNLTVQSLEETIASMEAMNWKEVIGDMEDLVDEMEDSLEGIKASAESISTIYAKLQSSFVIVDDALDAAGITKNISELITATLTASQLKTLESTLDSLEDQLDELKEQRDEYEKKTLPDTKRQIQSVIDQMVIGAETLYTTILSTQQQRDSLVDAQSAMDRTVAEMELRYQRGQISELTLLQVKNGAQSLNAGLGTLDVALDTMTYSLQSLLGDTVTGSLTLSALPAVSAADLDSVNYTKDLAKAKEASYDLYAAARAVEDAEDDMEEARKDEGKNSYQYKMAQHTYESAVLSEKSAVQSFELSFRGLYSQLAPARTAVANAENDLAYAQRVYETAQLKYQQGNLSANALADAKDTYETARRDCTAAQTDLFTAWHSYQNAVTYGVVSSGS